MSTTCVLASSSSLPPPFLLAILSLYRRSCATGPSLLSSMLPYHSVLAPSVSWVAGEFLSPPLPCPPQPVTLLPLGVTLEVLPPWGNPSTPGGFVPLGDSIPHPIHVYLH